jgi:hypothetical protein
VTAAPFVPPVSPYKICVVEAVTAEFVIVKVNWAPATIEGVVIVICPDLPFNVAEVVPEAVPEFNTIPSPAAELTKLPLVAVMLPVVAVIPVPPVNVVVEAIEPGAMKVVGIESVTAPAVVEAVISLAVPVTETISPVAFKIWSQFATSGPPIVVYPKSCHEPLFGHTTIAPIG